MTKFGQVIGYDETTGNATIRYARPEACEKCGACGTKTHQETITLKAACKPGDWVKVDLPDSHFLSATAIAYVIPLLCFLLGLWLGHTLSGGQELIALLGSLLGLGLGLVVLKLSDKLIAGKPSWTPTVTQVYDHQPEMDEFGCGGQG